MLTKANRALVVTKQAISAIDLTDKRVVVVGGTDGLGRAIAHLGAARGAAVTIIGRTNRDEGAANIKFIKADLSLVTEAKRVARSLVAEQSAGAPIDYLVLTTGVTPGATRTVTAEGIEKDMAVSALSRVVILDELAPRLPTNTRIFVMGFPGAGNPGMLGDLNSEKKYSAGFGQTHMNTVAGNEALVHHWAATGKHIYGLNPGLIATGIRDEYHGRGYLGSIMETVISWFNVTPERYAENILPVLVAPELETNKGAMFGQNGDAILPTPEFKDPTWVAKWITELRTLVAKAESASSTAAGSGAKLA
jgi:NAD(P)-dependent dehydrogenase (short-subunit alcohol dehydrogenase family)